MTLHKSTRFTVTLIMFAGLTGHAIANGHIDAKNCSDRSMKLCLYDWNDVLVSSPRESAWISSRSAASKACRKSWTSSDAPGCQVALLNKDSCSGSKDIGSMYSGPYTIWTAGYGSSANYLMASGKAVNCNGGSPKQFTLSGTEVSGCSEPPEIVLHDTLDLSNMSWVLKNRSLDDMTRVGVGSYGSRDDKSSMYRLNNNIRAIRFRAGKWEICQETHFGGQCMTFTFSGPVTKKLDTDWGGSWDRKISSVRPVSCP